MVKLRRFLAIDAPPWAYVAQAYALKGDHLDLVAEKVGQKIEEVRRWLLPAAS